jgi:hypothetical protein
VRAGRLSPRMHPTTAQALEAAAAAYGVDADHLARALLVDLLLRDAASLADVHRAVEHGLARYAARYRRLQAGLPSGEDSDRSALAT